ncbi:pentapeptide repeat-containing protein [Streptomyces sp. SR-10]|uniref:pentapeptide repeat-containing protein n=1 Tax=Streptomyces sp. SR-10 TaxID=3416442 RepID=UPI003CED5B5C
MRHTILRLIGDHYRRPKGTHRSWQGCDLDLTGVTIDGDMDCGGATFSGGTVSFRHATFSGGTVSFGTAMFSGSTVSFRSATFSSGDVSFDGATGPAPQGLLAAVGTPPPSGVTLPSAWLLSAP